MQALGASSPEETATAQIHDDREHEAVPSQAAGELLEDHGAGRHTAMNGDNPFLGADMGHPPGPRFTPSSPGTGPRPAPPAPHQRHDQPALAEGHFVDDGVPHAAEYAGTSATSLPQRHSCLAFSGPAFVATNLPVPAGTPSLVSPWKRRREGSQASLRPQQPVNLGTQVAKVFEGWGLYLGEVVGIQGGVYRVRFEDGEEERFEQEDMEKLRALLLNAEAEVARQGRNSRLRLKALGVLGEQGLRLLAEEEGDGEVLARAAAEVACGGPREEAGGGEY
ncbi:hypothetical protein NSK_003521 [Nannochloropsis salina CCMP1776]|uniref:Tudor domain-containing protein n=1 Tax=Nannochloropsis salina CCMP1776 TaxID=1027361 RepID=A0A4D9D3Z4_9STRA|nr:hypothetical protein NSK_003521 [Nannochloropsis salina CCMP1776]|eukprot:TFJ85097.1 hypothetical protein NSK_003521 [Nannochloropsis salina CCMP1776]